MIELLIILFVLASLIYLLIRSAKLSRIKTTMYKHKSELEPPEITQVVDIELQEERNSDITFQ